MWDRTKQTRRVFFKRWGNKHKKHLVACTFEPFKFDDDERETPWTEVVDEHGTKGASLRRLMQQAEKHKNERHHTYATFLFRDVKCDKGGS